MQNTTKSKIAAFADMNHLSVDYQPLKFGFERAVFRFDTYSSFADTLVLLPKKIRGITLEHHVARSLCCFEGTIYAMDNADHTALSALLKREQEACEDWWQRYHNADDATRRLMACGAIN